jgi:hypothetical protein
MLGAAAIDDALTAAAFTRRRPSARDPCTTTCPRMRGVIRYTTKYAASSHMQAFASTIPSRAPAIGTPAHNAFFLACCAASPETA